MREILKPDGEVYAWVSVEDGLLKLKMNQGTAKGLTVQLDAKIVPQLRQILTEAEILNYV